MLRMGARVCPDPFQPLGKNEEQVNRNKKKESALRFLFVRSRCKSVRPTTHKSYKGHML